MTRSNAVVKSCQVTAVGSVLALLAGCTLGAGSYNNSLGQRSKCDAFAKWASQFNEKFPGSSFAADKVAFLYRDESFVPVFGTPFDKLSPEQQQQLASSLPSCFDLQIYQGAIYASQNYRVLVSPLMTNPPGWYSSSEISREWMERIVSRDREDTEWMHSALKEAGHLPETEEGYYRVRQLWVRGDRLTNLPPTQQKQFQETLSQDVSRISGPVLLLRMNTAVAKASTYEGLKQLKLTMENSDNLRLHNDAPAEARAKAKDLVKRTFDTGLQKLLEEEWHRFEGRGKGATAVKNGASWYREFEKQYVKVFDLGARGNDMLARFHEQRKKDLSEAKEEMAVLVASAQGELDPQDYLLDGELDDKSFSTWILTFKAAMRFEKEKWKFSTDELALMKTRGIITVPSHYGPPSAEAIRLALLRSFVNAGGEQLDAYTATVVTASVEDMLPGAAFGGFGGVALTQLPRVPVGEVKIGSLRIESCSEGGNGGYQCRYKVDQSFKNLAATASSADTRTDEFVLTSSGWSSASANSRVEEAKIRGTAKIAEDINRALPKPGCVGRQQFTNPACRK